MTKLEIALVPCLSDNYCVLLHDGATGATAAVDAPDADAIIKALDDRNWKLTDLLITHHHTDHTQGIGALKERFGCKVTGPAGEADRIAHIDKAVDEKTPMTFAGRNVRVIEAPGHTLGHILYFFPDEDLLFSGDTLFSLGCGRIFEGEPEAMFAALQKVMELPDTVSIYCGHEYTASNGKFALSIEPENDDLQKRMTEVKALREKNLPTLPANLKQEKATNPFLRTNSSTIRARLGLERAPDWKVFARLRELKNKA